MSLLSTQGLSFAFIPDAELFRGVTFSIHSGDRIGLVGPNGSGKSTLLRLLHAAASGSPGKNEDKNEQKNELAPSSGSIARARGLAAAMAQQELHPSERHRSLFDFVLASDDGEGEAARLLAGLEFPLEDWDREVNTLSGGEWSRAQLARVLAQRPDLLLLDEPTNHLDLGVRGWLAAELASRSDCACIAASHDRAFLEEFAERMIEIERSRFQVYEGSYAFYREMKQLRSQQEWAEYEAYGRRKSAMEAAAEKRDKLAVKVAIAPPGARHSKDFYARKASKVARTGRLLRERVRGPENAVRKPWEEQPIDGLTFEHMARSSDVVLTAEGLSKSYGERRLFQNLSFYLRRGERLVITGPNGSGKTTLLNILAGMDTTDRGTVHRGANVITGSVAQVLDKQFDYAKSPLELCGTSTNARTLLACLKVPICCLNRPLHSLSGGERTKVALASILNSSANLLLLDEPTNHLEIEAREALEQALAMYPGTIIAISHDDLFLEAMSTQQPAIIELGGRKF